MKELTLKRLKNTEFPILYKKLLLSSNLNENDLKSVLALSMAFLRFKNKKINDLGYRLILLYAKKTRDYKPLYELSQNNGLIPISKYIYSTLKYGDKFGNMQTEINDLQNESYNIDGAIRTKEQKKLIQFTKSNQHKSKVIVAPTSYGKTELIIDMIQKNARDNICITTPSKSLLAQTKRRIIKVTGNKKIITQPEMYSKSEESIIAVLTQERLLRLLKLEKDLSFDMLIIDEAHNLLEKTNRNSNRSVILASVLILCFSRNRELTCNFLTPALKSTKNLKIKYTEIDFVSHIVSEIVKSELFFFYDIYDNSVSLYDQYMNDFIKVENIQNLKDDSTIVLSNANSKNIIYLNKPKDLERFAKELSLKIPVLSSPNIVRAVNDLKEYIHPDYNLAHLLEKGVVYHHGAVPEAIRFFIEDLYANIPELKFLVANSTLLEGVNIPATKMFILNPNKGKGYLTPSAFRNLIGRVCRFNEIFDKENGSLDYLLPEIHIIKGKYSTKSFTPRGFVKKTRCSVSVDFNDKNNNPLLENSDSNDENRRAAYEFVENISSDTIVNDPDIRRVQTEFGRLCYENNIDIFDIINHEIEVTSEISALSESAEDVGAVFNLMDHLFYKRIDEKENFLNNIKRLKDVKTRNFYKMILSWRMKGLKTSEMVLKMVNHWQAVDVNELTYVGRWGDKKREGFAELWTNISEKNYSEKINLAIVRLKEEFDFVDNEIIKYIEVLYQLDLIKEDLYLKIKYGTNDPSKIALINCGISNYLSNLLSERYSDYFDIDIERSNVIFEYEIIKAMEDAKENGVLITEVKLNIGI